MVQHLEVPTRDRTNVSIVRTLRYIALRYSSYILYEGVRNKSEQSVNKKGKARQARPLHTPSGYRTTIVRSTKRMRVKELGNKGSAEQVSQVEIRVRAVPISLVAGPILTKEEGRGKKRGSGNL